MNYIELTKICELCRLVNDDVACREAIELDRCQIKQLEKR